jgi:hypothetical protein
LRAVHAERLHVVRELGVQEGARVVSRNEEGALGRSTISDMTCDFTLVPSRAASCFIALAAAATLLLLAALPGWPEARIAAMVWCMGIAGHAFKRQRAAHAVRVDGASITIDGIEGRIVTGSFVAPWLTIVRWRPQGARFTRTLPVLPDAIDAGTFRALRVILRWAPPR